MMAKLRNSPEIRQKIIDLTAEIRHFLLAMALIVPSLPLNPLRPRAFGGKGAEGMEKQIPSNITDNYRMHSKLRWQVAKLSRMWLGRRNRCAPELGQVQGQALCLYSQNSLFLVF